MKRPFSIRYGHKETSNVLQVESMSDALSNSLWNCILKHYFNEKNTIRDSSGYAGGPWMSKPLYKTIEEFWINYLKEPIDQINDHWEPMYKMIRKMFLYGDWHFVYDFIEFFANNNYTEDYNRYNDKELRYRGKNLLFINACNAVLETECSGYRFVDGYITPITDPIEIQEIETALSQAQKETKIHIRKAIKALSDKKGTNLIYKDSIRESIHAVEAICKKISSQNTLGAALKDISKNSHIQIHPALNEAFQKIYGYTSDQGGIRHAEGIGEGSDVSFEDAKFMLVAVSAFVNYLTVKIDKAGIKL